MDKKEPDKKELKKMVGEYEPDEYYTEEEKKKMKNLRGNIIDHLGLR